MEKTINVGPTSKERYRVLIIRHDDIWLTTLGITYPVQASARTFSLIVHSPTASPSTINSRETNEDLKWHGERKGEGG